jgi:Uri superfamily endonuclease
LLIPLPRPHRLTIGRLGVVAFPTGDYLYLGSACGPGGLRARLGRHLSASRRPRWHIDGLLAVARPAGLYYLAHPPFDEQTIKPECSWSQAMTSLPGACIPASGFGSSDCRSGCRAHLVAFLAERARWRGEMANHQQAEPDGFLRLVQATLEGAVGCGEGEMGLLIAEG